MAPGQRTFQYAIGVDDNGSLVFDKFEQVVNETSGSVAKSLQGIDNAMQSTGRSTNRLTQFIREQRAEQRQQNFLYSQGKDVIGAASVALGIFGNTAGRANPQMQSFTNSLNSGFIAFQGLDFLLSGVAGPWGQAIALAGGIAAGVASLGAEAEESKKRVRELDDQILDLDVKLGKKSDADKFRSLNERLAENRKELDSTIDSYSRGLAIAAATGVPLIGKLFGSDEEISKITVAMKKLEVEQQDIIDKQAGANADRLQQFLEGLDDTPLKGLTGSTAELKRQEAELKKNLDELVPRTDGYNAVLVKLAGVEKQLHDEESYRALQMKNLTDNTDAATTSLGKFGTVTKQLPNFFQLPKLTLDLDTSVSESTLDGLRLKIKDVEDAVNELDVNTPEFAAMKGQLEILKGKMEAALITPTERFQREFQKATGAIARSFDLLAQAASNNSEEELNGIEARKEASLGRIDEELSAETLSEEEKKRLTKERAALEKKFRDEERSAKARAFQADKEAKIIQSIIDTASAVVEALPDIPLSILAGVLGAAQTAVIAGQPTPRFHGGGTAYIDAPESQEVPILVRGRETVRVTTPEQERDFSGAGGTLNIYISNSTIGDDEALKRLIEGGMRKMGVTDPAKYFKNVRAGVAIAA